MDWQARWMVLLWAHSGGAAGRECTYGAPRVMPAALPPAPTCRDSIVGTAAAQALLDQGR